MMKLMTLTIGLAVAGAVALGAQSSETTTRTKVEVKDGKDGKVTGCVESAMGGTFILTEVASKGRGMHQYTLVSDSDDFSKHVGHRVQIEGTIGDRDHGKVKVETETKMDGQEKDTHSKTEGPGAYLGVEHMKMVPGACPQ